MRNIYIDDMMVGESLEDSVSEYCNEGGFLLINFEEVGDRYTVDGVEYAEVVILVK